MMNLQGSWVAMPTPFTEDNQVDIEGFKLLIARQIKYGTNQLFILGSAGEVTLLSIEEKKLIVKSVIAYMKDRAARGLKVVPVFFSAASFTTEASVEFAQFCEAEGADGVVFTVPPYVLITQHAAKTHLDTCMSSVSIPCGIYNNPSRLGVQVLPETIKTCLRSTRTLWWTKRQCPAWNSWCRCSACARARSRSCAATTRTTPS